MKNLKHLFPLALVACFIYVITTVACRKELPLSVPTQDSVSLISKGTVDYTNPNPTWTQITSPILRPAKWNDYTFAGFTAGLPGPYNNQYFQIYDTTIVMKWHLHVGTRYFNGKWKPANGTKPPRVKLIADAIAACTGRALVCSNWPNSSRICVSRAS